MDKQEQVGGGGPRFTIKIFRDTRMDYSEWMAELYVGQGLSEAELVEYGGLPVFGEGDTITEALSSLSQRWGEYVIEQAISALADSPKQAPGLWPSEPQAPSTTSHQTENGVEYRKPTKEEMEFSVPGMQFKRFGEWEDGTPGSWCNPNYEWRIPVGGSTTGLEKGGE